MYAKTRTVPAAAVRWRYTRYEASISKTASIGDTRDGEALAPVAAVVFDEGRVVVDGAPGETARSVEGDDPVPTPSVTAIAVAMTAAMPAIITITLRFGAAFSMTLIETPRRRARWCCRG